jgi:hypothetical protein
MALPTISRSFGYIQVVQKAKASGALRTVARGSLSLSLSLPLPHFVLLSRRIRAKRLYILYIYIYIVRNMISLLHFTLTSSLLLKSIFKDNQIYHRLLTTYSSVISTKMLWNEFCNILLLAKIMNKLEQSER